MSTEKKSLLSFNDFFAGSVAGVIQVLLGQPLDLMKVRMQTNPSEYKNLIQTAKAIFKNEGPLAFYKGTLSPLCGISFCVAIQFSANEMAKNFFKNKNISDKKENPLNLTYSQYILCGIFTGFCISYVLSPVELFRIKMQVQNKDSSIKYKGTGDCALTILKTNGLKGVYQGWTSTVIREMPANALYFGVYESLVQWSIKRYSNRNEIPLLHFVTHGALAGVALWIGTFHLDVIKSRIQSDNFNDRKYKSFLYTTKHIYQENGIKGFYKGIGPCLVRAPIINAATFLTFESITKALKK